MIIFGEDIHISDNEKEFILKNLPTEWETFIKQVCPSSDMEVYLKVNAKTIEETNTWISQFQDQTTATYSVHNTRKCAGERLTYKKIYRCHHNTRRKETYDPVHRKHVKNTKCPSFLMVHMRVTGKRYRGKNQNDKPDPDKPCEIKVRLRHNHSLTDEMASKFRRVLPEIRNELINLYKQGHTPATALQRLKSDIRMNYENHDEILGDRSKCPDYRFCHYIYERYIVKAEDQLNLNEEFLENKIENYNHVMNDDCAKMVIDDTGYVICFCPPFVKRVHKYGTSSSTVAFIYTTNISDKNGSKVYILLTYCEVGALPLGVIVSTSKSTDMLYSAFLLLKNMLGETAFGGNGATGPAYFVVEEPLAQQNILNSLWPQSTTLFGVSFVLRNIWRVLSSTSVKNQMSLEDKLILFTDFYNVIYAPTELDFLSKYDAARNNAIKYEHYLKLLNNYYDKRKQWALCYRTNLFLRGNSIVEKYSETVFRIMKTRDLLRLKSFNIFQSVDFIINNFFLYFEHRLLDAANTGSVNSILEMKVDMPTIETLQKIKILGNSIHFVPADKTKELIYLVNTDLLTCTCFNGYPGTICKHVQWMCLLVHSDIFGKKKLNISDIRNNYYQITKEDFPVENQCETITINNDININSERNNALDFLEIKHNSEIATNIETQPDINLFDIKNNIFFDDAIIVEVENNLMAQEKNEVTKEKYIEEGKEIWKKMTQIYEDFLYNSPEEVVSASKNMSSNLEKMRTITDFCSACNKFGSQKPKINQNIQPTNKEVAAATKLLLLSAGNTHHISEQTVVVNSSNERVAANQSRPLQPANEPGMKRILLLSGNISCVEGPVDKKIKLIPIQNSTIVNNTT